MAKQRCLLEIGTGVDMHGRDSTKAARRAVADAIRHSSPSFVGVFGYDPMAIFVEVNIAVPNHETVRPGEVLQELPYGHKSINVVEGGMEIPEGGTVIANAAVIVSLDVPE